MVSKKLLECPHMFDGANCTLIFDVDQDKWCLVCVKDPWLIDVSSPSKYKSRLKKRWNKDKNSTVNSSEY